MNKILKGRKNNETTYHDITLQIEHQGDFNLDNIVGLDNNCIGACTIVSDLHRQLSKHCLQWLPRIQMYMTMSTILLPSAFTGKDDKSFGKKSRLRNGREDIPSGHLSNWLHLQNNE
jgi:hypothetical protein